MRRISVNEALREEKVVAEYFDLISSKDMERLLSLFASDAVIYEPFSNVDGGLKGISAIEPFLRIAMMAYEGLEYRIATEKENIGNSTKVIANVTFERGDSIDARFTFELVPEKKNNMQKKIKTLRIQFV